MVSPTTIFNNLSLTCAERTGLPFHFRYDRRRGRVVVFPTERAFRFEPFTANNTTVRGIITYLRGIVRRSYAGELIPGFLYYLGVSHRPGATPPLLPVADYYGEPRVGRTIRDTLLRARLDREMFRDRAALFVNDREWSYRDPRSRHTFSVIFDPMPNGVLLLAIDEQAEAGQEFRWYPTSESIPPAIRKKWPIRIVDLLETLTMVVRQN